MSKTTGKRGFVPAQPAAAISTLDFAAASQAFDQALATAPTGDDDATDAHADQIAKAADWLLSTPAATPAQIAEKVRAYGWMHTITADLANPESQRFIAAGSHDPAKGLLAIYLDLTAQPDRTAWDRALADFNAAQAAHDAVCAGERENDEDSDGWGPAWDRLGVALEALLNVRAPDAAAMGLKARLVIQRHYEEHRDDSPHNPNTLSRMMTNGGWGDHFTAAIYQDALAIAGDTSPARYAKPDPFDGVAWLKQAEAGGTVVTPNDPGYGVTFTGSDAEALEAAFAALAPWKRDEVISSVYAAQEAATAEEREQERDRQPTPPEELRALGARLAANTYPEAEREGIYNALCGAMGLTQ